MSTALRTNADGLAGAISFTNIDNVKLTNTGPELLGTPLVPTAAANTNTKQAASTAFVTAAIATAVSSGGPQPSNATPAMDAAGTPGVSTNYSRGDHVHLGHGGPQACDLPVLGQDGLQDGLTSGSSFGVFLGLCHACPA